MLAMTKFVCYADGMPDDKSAKNEKTPAAPATPDGDSGSTTTPAVEEAVKPAAPSLAEDLAELEKLNLMRAVMLRMQGGRHPNAEVDALLKRRLDLKAEDFQGPYAIRLICTLMMVFLICIIMWGSVWLVTTAFELSAIARLMSTAIATLMAAAAGVAIFHPSSVPDEKLVKEIVTHRMAELRDEGASVGRPAGNADTKKPAEAETSGEEELEPDEAAEKPLDAVAPDRIE